MSSGQVDLMVGNRPLSSLRVVDLKQELEKRGLSKSGSKKDLVDRLRLHLQIEKHRDTGASADEEELPNYSQVHDTLADQNPFIRDYLASQAELFHSQKVVKKLVEEEAKRESETSADEGVDSPMKQPVTLEREESPVTETRRQSRRRIDSQREDMTAEKLTTRSSRSRSSSKDDSRSRAEEEKKNEADKNGEEPRQTESPTVETVCKPQRRSNSRSVSRSPIREKNLVEKSEAHSQVLQPEQKDEPETTSDIKSVETEKKMDVDESSSSLHVDNTTQDNMDKSKAKEGAEHNRSAETPMSAQPETVPKVDAEEKVVEAEQKDEPNEPQIASDIKPVETEKKMDLDESKSSTTQDNLEELKTKEGAEQSISTEKPVSAQPVSVQELEVGKKIVESEHKDEPEISSDIKSAETEEKMEVDESSSPRSASREDSTSSGEEDRKSEPDENGDESREADSPTIELVCQPRRSLSRSVSRSPVREKSPVEKSESYSEEPKHKEEPETTSDIKSAEAEEKMDLDESSSSRYKSSQKETSYTNNDIAGEEALDYGEEEDDEDRNESDPQEFSWTRRSIRFKNKAVFAAPTCKWKLEEESKHLVVKSELLNSYYEDIKLVPLEQLKLEEKPSESATETKKEVDRKPSISKESEPEEPLPKRTVENVVPTIKRTVSIIPSTKTTTENVEEPDKALTPPRNPQSDVLLITNLVRPFTIIQLKEMLQRTGNLQDIWVDKIKSKCIAKFASQEEAFETRAALHGVCWPNSNPKSLHVDYTTQDNLDEHKAKEGAEQNISTEKPVSAQPVPVREWDVGKKAEPKSPPRNRKRSRSRSTSRDRSKRSRRTPSPGRRRRSKSPGQERRSRGGEGKEPEPMGKALDELFRKTIATPSIYWLPLTPEQIAEKEELRRKRMLERERRLAELSKMRR